MLRVESKRARKNLPNPEGMNENSPAFQRRVDVEGYKSWRDDWGFQNKMGDKKGATESAERSIVLAKEAKSDDYVRLNEKLIADIKAGK